MFLRLVVLASLLTSATALAQAADEPPKKSRMRELLRARAAQDANEAQEKKAAAPAAPAANSASTSKTEPAAGDAKSDPVAAKPPASKSESETKKEGPTVLPKMEVRKDRITELDRQLSKQERDIARERKNLQISEVDTALNDMKIARPLALFGGESAQFRRRVASERVELMEAEKDLIEAIARAKTKEEKEELQKQLDQLKAFRRELDKSLR